MSDRYFLDTNVFVYSFDNESPEKLRTAQRLIGQALQDGMGLTSFQVIQEFASVATRKFKQPMTTQDLLMYIDGVLGPLCEVQSSISLYESCIAIQEQTGYTFYDSLIVAAAAGAGCRMIYTEDLQEGRTVAGVKIFNPF